jgi:hypothetical protein
VQHFYHLLTDDDLSTLLGSRIDSRLYARLGGYRSLRPGGFGCRHSATGSVATYRMDLPRPTTFVGTRIDYLVGPWDYSVCATRHLMAWGARTTVEK